MGQAGCIEAGAEDDSIRITLTVPDGWAGLEISVVPSVESYSPPGGAGLLFMRGGWLYSPSSVLAPGTSTQGRTIPTGTTVDEFVTALVDHPDLDVTSPVDVTLGGYSGQYLELRAPANTTTDELGPEPERVRLLLRVGTRDLRPGAERPVAHLGPRCGRGPGGGPEPTASPARRHRSRPNSRRSWTRSRSSPDTDAGSGGICHSTRTDPARQTRRLSQRRMTGSQAAPTAAWAARIPNRRRAGTPTSSPGRTNVSKGEVPSPGVVETT